MSDRENSFHEQEEHYENGDMDGDQSKATDEAELAAMKARVREMEEEAEKLKQLQSEVDKQMSMGSPPNSTTHLSFQDPSPLSLPPSIRSPIGDNISVKPFLLSSENKVKEEELGEEDREESGKRKLMEMDEESSDEDEKKWDKRLKIDLDSEEEEEKGTDGEEELGEVDRGECGKRKLKKMEESSDEEKEDDDDRKFDIRLKIDLDSEEEERKDKNEVDREESDKQKLIEIDEERKEDDDDRKFDMILKFHLDSEENEEEEEEEEEDTKEVDKGEIDKRKLMEMDEESSDEEKEGKDKDDEEVDRESGDLKLIDMDKESEEEEEGTDKEDIEVVDEESGKRKLIEMMEESDDRKRDKRLKIDLESADEYQEEDEGEKEKRVRYERVKNMEVNRKDVQDDGEESYQRKVETMEEQKLDEGKEQQLKSHGILDRMKERDVEDPIKDHQIRSHRKLDRMNKSEDQEKYGEINDVVVEIENEMYHGKPGDTDEEKEDKGLETYESYTKRNNNMKKISGDTTYDKNSKRNDNIEGKRRKNTTSDRHRIINDILVEIKNERAEDTDEEEEDDEGIEEKFGRHRKGNKNVEERSGNATPHNNYSKINKTIKEGGGESQKEVVGGVFARLGGERYSKRRNETAEGKRNDKFNRRCANIEEEEGEEKYGKYRKENKLIEERSGDGTPHDKHRKINDIVIEIKNKKYNQRAENTDEEEEGLEEKYGRFKKRNDDMEERSGVVIPHKNYRKRNETLEEKGNKFNRRSANTDEEGEEEENYGRFRQGNNNMEERTSEYTPDSRYSKRNDIVKGEIGKEVVEGLFERLDENMEEPTPSVGGGKTVGVVGERGEMYDEDQEYDPSTAGMPLGDTYNPTDSLLNLSVEEKKEADLRSIYVGNVDYGATAEELEAHFHGCGSVNRVTILCNKFDGHPKGFAYIEFADKDSVQTAMAMDESLFRGRQIKVNPKRTNRPGISTTNRGAARARGRGGRVARGGMYGGYRPMRRARSYRRGIYYPY